MILILIMGVCMSCTKRRETMKSGASSEMRGEYSHDFHFRRSKINVIEIENATFLPLIFNPRTKNRIRLILNVKITKSEFG